MSSLRFALVACALMIGTAPSPAQAQAKLIKNLFSHVMKSAEVDAHFAKIQDSWDVYTKTNHAVTFRVSTKRLPATEHMEADEYWFVRKGTARVVLQTGTPTTSSPQDASAGDVLYVPPFLWRFLVDRRHQGRGIGHRALTELVDRLTREGSRSLRVSWVEGPGSPRRFYERFGFSPTGEVAHGETVAQLDW